jgi:subtilisin family serine protease
VNPPPTPPPPVVVIPAPPPPPVIGETNLPPRVPPQHVVNQAEPPPPQAPKPPTNQHAATPPPTEPPRIARVSGPRPSGVPPKDEHRYVPDEVLFELRAGVSPQTIDAIARRQRLQRLASQPLELIGTTLYRYKIMDKRSVPTVVAVLERDARIATVQPNYLYRLQGEQNGPLAGNQYAGPKMHLPEAHTISNGGNTLVAVIDSGIDSTQPEIAGTITESFDAIDGGNGGKAIPGSSADGIVHGTEVAGIIASHADLTGVAPQAHILAVRAFKRLGGAAVAGTTYDLAVGTDWAVKHNAQVVNMSFGGPFDPEVARILAEGLRRRVIFIAAVGNEGKAAKPSYPAAYEDVIPVTATDRVDAIFKDASRCSTTCVAAPGVDVLVAAPGIYQYDSGTSMAAAQVSGVVALLLDAKPDLDPKTVRDLLVNTAKHLSLPDPDESSIAGIVDAYAMLEAANANPVVTGLSVGLPDLPAPPTPKDVEPPQNAPPVDNSPTGSVKPDAQPDSKSVSTATDAELARKEEVLWQLKKDGLISMDQFQRQLQDLEAAKKEFINKCPPAPHLPGVVKAEFQESDRARAIALIHDYGLEGKLNDSIDLTKITVPVGQEWFWVDVLQASGLFAHVDRENYFCPESVDTIIGIGHPDIDLPKPTAKVTRAGDLEDIVAFLKTKYPKPTEVTEVIIDPNQRIVKVVEINGLRGSVVRGYTYWERLKINLVFIKPGEVMATVEGFYATGAGDHLPATSAYKSIDNDYPVDISNFTKTTLFADLQQQ